MSLASGQSLLHYRLIEQIGAGGMGVVYRATDTKLRRDVAIKVLPDDFARDAGRLTRFEREAHTLASLNHPSIASIYGVEEADGVRFLVLELVPGETLADRLSRGPLPVDEAREVARQIAEALEEAHEHGIIHRDVKPANVKLTPEGRVKVLDFGLARPSLADEPAGSLSDSPTVAMDGTRTGAILGTAAYMSPEQARGQVVDRRADIWAFGCCLFEALTGKKAFEGLTTTDLFAEIVKSDPDWGALPDDTPARMRVLLWRCLQKDPRQRLRDIGEARFALGQDESDPANAPGSFTTAAPGRVTRRAAIAASLITLICGAAITGGVMWLTMRGAKVPADISAARPVKRFEIDIGRTVPLDIADVAAEVAISPDGSRLAYTANVDGVKRLYLRELDKPGSRVLPGTEHGWRPFFSPDGQWIGLFLPGPPSSGDGKLVKIAVQGGTMLELCHAFPPAGGAWLDDGSIVFTNQDDDLDLTISPFLSHLFRVSANGGTPERLVVVGGKARDEMTHCLPRAAPGQRFFTFTTVDSSGQPDAALFDLDTGRHEKLLDDALGAQYVRSGHLVFLRNDALWAARFDPHSHAVGEPVIVQQDVQMNKSGTAAPFALSAEGSLVYVPSAPVEARQRRLVWVDHDGREETIAVPPARYWWPRVSPDGSRVAMSIQESRNGNEDIWIHQFGRAQSMIRFTFDSKLDDNPLWSPDGKYLYFTSHRLGGGDLFRRRADGVGAVEPILRDPETKYPAEMTADGATLLFGRPVENRGWDIMELRLAGRGHGSSPEEKARPLLDSEFNEGGTRLSPDGRWLAYNTDETNPTQVFVRPFPNVDDGRWQVSTDGGINPSWSADGREIYYRNGAKMMGVSVQTAPTFRPGKARELFEGDYYYAPDLSVQYDVEYPGRKRFLMMKELPDTRTTKLVDVENWFQELDRLVPESAR